VDDLFDGVRLCGAHCVFCFVEQLPKGLRKPLYLKDDDYRLSFIHGNFITLANVADSDLERIVTQRLSPLYVSVHTTDPDLRDKMLGRAAPNILDQIDRLSRGRITLHTQIVLCRGINDGEALQRTLDDLSARYPTVASIAIVPAGVSAHRRHPTPIPPIDAQYSAAIIDTLEHMQRLCLGEKGTRLVWAADEFYLSAGRRIPSARTYEGYPQIENGIGLVRQFKESAARTRAQLRSATGGRGDSIGSGSVQGAASLSSGCFARRHMFSLVTGYLAAPILTEWAESLREWGISLGVFPVVNRLFGESVTVAGLMSGRDLIDQLRGRDLGEALFVPSVALRDGAFLDDVTLETVAAELGVRVVAVAPRPYPLLRSILDEAVRL